ncbi:glycosyltransferase family 61 protein [Pontibacter harenae]|uniref:glycosyltransferase family 61 protein n=1 Tax=Pontibacter harenae TaxID=2894083 RepID=UPI001E506103|nr:glycosyltransferase family 61 protein [Pontibacter harenae]MCC9166765.1 glycosyltransferase family 61 protein [Pontibacter harenae]
MKIKVLYTKGSKRIKKILGRFIPYNTRYKPTGVCKINQENPELLKKSEITVHPVYPNLVTSLDISEDLFDAISDYWKPQRQVTTDYMVVDVPMGRLYTDHESSVAIITRYNKVVENVSLSLTGGKVTEPNLNNIFEQRYFVEPTKFEGTVFSLLTGGAGINNISHWFVDVLPRLHLLKQSGLYDQVDWFLMPSLRYDYQRETLELLGIPANKLIEGDKHIHITADRILASTAPRGNHTLVPTWLCQYIKDSFMPYADEQDVSSATEEAPYLYISRSDSSIRNVLNEKELLEALEPYGFKNVVSSKLSIIEKIKLFSQAKVVMGACGAGLINMLFCQPGTKLIEVYNEGFILEPFYDIATKTNLDHQYVICKGNKNVKTADQGMKEHVVFEIDKILALLQELDIPTKEETVEAEIDAEKEQEQALQS